MGHSKSKKKVTSPILKEAKSLKRLCINDALSDYPIFVFDKIDKNGPFAFDTSRERFNHKEFLEKMINYSRMTWHEIARQTHDNGKSKHHYLDIGKLSNAAKERLFAMKLDDYSDDIWSFAFTNKLRIVGIRLNDYFHVLWYDSKHEIFPSRKKHT